MDFRQKIFFLNADSCFKSLLCTRLTNLIHFTSQRAADRSLCHVLTQQQQMSKAHRPCSNTHLVGDAAVVFGSFQEDPAVVFLSPLVLIKQQQNESNKALKTEDL